MTKKIQLQVHSRSFSLIRLPGAEQVREGGTEPESLDLALNAGRESGSRGEHMVGAGTKSRAPKNYLIYHRGAGRRAGEGGAKLCL